MSFQRRASWTALALAAALVGGCGDDGPNQADLDAAVAKALATTTTTGPAVAATAEESAAPEPPPAEPAFTLPRAAQHDTSRPASNPAPPTTPAQPASVPVPSVPPPKPGYVPTRAECNGLSLKVTDAIDAWVTTVGNVNSSATLSYIDDVLRLGNQVLGVARDAVKLCTGIWSSSYDLGGLIPEVEATLREVQGYRDQRLKSTTTTRPATTTTKPATTTSKPTTTTTAKPASTTTTKPASTTTAKPATTTTVKKSPKQLADPKLVEAGIRAYTWEARHPDADILRVDVYNKADGQRACDVAYNAVAPTWADGKWWIHVYPYGANSPDQIICNRKV